MKEVAVAETAAPVLCDELITNILLRVPGKTLTRCKLVCKHWQNLITDAYFFQALKSTPPITAGFFYFKRFNDYRAKYYCCITNEIYHNVIPPDDDLITPFAIVASHNGLVLCAESSKIRQRLFICNPYTKEWVTLPRNPTLPNIFDDNFVLFCYEKQESSSGQLVEFKVLNFFTFHGWGLDVENPYFLQAEIYSSETGEWTISERLPIFDYFYITEWEKILLAPDFVYIWNHEHSKACIYDLNRKTLQHIMLPRSNDEEYCPKRHLGVSVGSVYYAELNATGIRMWVHDQGDEWTLEHIVSFDKEPALRFYATFHLVGLHPLKLGLVMISDGGGFPKNLVVLYHADRREMELLPSFHDSDNTQLVPYLLPAWLPRLKSSKSMNRGVWRSPLSLHEEVDTIHDDDDSTLLFLPGSSAYNLNFPALNDVITGN